MVKTHSIFRFALLVLWVLDFNSYAETGGTKQFQESHDSSSSTAHEVDWHERPIYLLKVKPGIATKEKVIDGKLISKRLYIRYEPRFFIIDESTGKKKVTGAIGVDFTNDEKKFLEEPRRLLRVGSVVPGSFLGDTDDRSYEFTAGEGTFAERFKVTEKPVSYKVLNFYADGRCTEAIFGPNSKGIW